MRSSLRFSPINPAPRSLGWVFLLLMALPWLAQAQNTNGPACSNFITRTTANGLSNNNVSDVYVVGNTVYAATGGGLSISTDGGQNFISYTTANGLGGNDVLDVYVVSNTVYAATGSGLSISTNGGQNFINYTTANGLGSNYVNEVYVVGSTIYAATNGGGLSISTNGGTSFTTRNATNSGLGDNFVKGVYAVGNTVYAATGSGLSISTDGGTSFTTRTGTNSGLGSNLLYKVYAVGNTVYVATFGGGLSISTNGGNSFVNRTQKANGLGEDVVVAVYAVGNTIYVATGRGLSISTDGGQNFSNYTTSNGLGDNSVSGVYAVGGRIYAATQGGVSFCPAPPPTLAGLSTNPKSVCTGQPTQFTATVGNANTYSYTLTNGAGSTLVGTASSSTFSQSLTAVGAGAQSYTLTVTTNGGVATTTTGLTVTTQSPDYQPLVDLYTSTGGDNWKNHTGWLTGCTPCGWYGVTCDGSGRVTGLSLASNNLSGSIPASLSAITNLQTLDLRQNILSGPIPTSLSALTNLQTLNLTTNKLSGSIPASLSALANLQFLYLGQNQLSGSIPASLSALTNLQTLDLTTNQLSGSIPVSLSALTKLTSLFLERNQLSGSIPAGLGNLNNLGVLFLNNNQLSGCFPASLSAFCGVPYIDFANNANLPGGGDFAAFCASGAGSDAFRPLATVSPNPVCAGSPVSLSVTTGTFYQWSGPASFSATTPTPTFIPATAASSGVYSVTVGNGSPTCTATASVSLTVNPQPTVSISPSATAVCAGQSALFAATPGLAAYRWSTPNNGPVLTTASISVSVAGTYSLTVTSASGCTATAQASLTVNPLPTPTIQGLPTSICQEAPPISLTGNPAEGSPAGGVFTIDGLTATTFNPAKLSVGQHTVVYSVTNTSGCANTASQTVTVKPTPQTPTIATQSGHAYPAGVSSLTISQNTGDVILTASGCMGGTITWQGGNSTTLAVSTFNTGTQTFTATCSNNGCTSPIATATITVVGTTLSVLHRDGNGNTSTNTLAPYLQLQNDGKTAIPYAEITVRYWLTVENYSPLQFQINYAQLGSDKVHLKYVPATTGNPKATGYIEFSFDASAGSLGAMSNSGPIQDLINKQDYSSFDQSNDYSYAPVGQYTPNPRITAYRNGTIFYGMEPGVVTPTRSLKAQLQNNTGDGANTIEAVLQVTNDGSLPVNYSDLKVRYYFTQDNNQPLVLSQVGYTALGSGNVTAQLVGISPAPGGADTYLELSFAASLGQLAPGASTGGVTYQLRHADYSGFTQANDYSYQGTGGLALAPHVVVLVGGQRVWGTEPGAAGRLAASEPETPLQVRVLGNPVRGSAIELEVRGAEGQPLRVQVMDQQGRLVSERSLEQAGAVEGQTVPIGNQPAGLLLLRVSTPSQSQTVKVLKTE